MKNFKGVKMTKKYLKEAIKLASIGIPVFPLHSPNKNGECSCGRPDCQSNGKHPRTLNGFKDATTDEKTITDLWTKWSDANIGICTGKASEILVIDIDIKHDGDKTLQELENEHGKLPLTPKVISGGGGSHYYFKYPDNVDHIKSRSNIAQGIDVRADGGYIVAPPSWHASCNCYKWIKGQSIHDIELAEIPDWLLNLTLDDKKKNNYNQAKNESFIEDGCRNSTLTSLAGSMHVRGMSKEAILAALLADNDLRCNPPLSEDEVKTIVVSVTRYPRNDSKNITGSEFNLTDVGNAKRLVKKFGDVIRYCHEIKKWFIWNQKRWKPDNSDQITRLAKETVANIIKEIK